METKKGKLREIVNWLIPTLLGHGRPWPYYLRNRLLEGEVEPGCYESGDEKADQAD